MKHGDKGKGKTAGKKSSKATGVSKAASKNVGTKARSEKAGGKSNSTKAVAPRAGDGKTKAREDAGGFSNPAVASAFKWAVKKYPNAFRKLTD